MRQTFISSHMNIYTPPVSRGRPLFSTNKPSLKVWSTLCTASEARLCIPLPIHTGELSHGQHVAKQSEESTQGMKSCTLLSWEEKEEQSKLPGRNKGLEEITWIIESIPCPQPGNIVLDQRTLLFPTLQNPQSISQHLIIISRPLLQKEL